MKGVEKLVIHPDYYQFTGQHDVDDDGAGDAGGDDAGGDDDGGDDDGAQVHRGHCGGTHRCGTYQNKGGESLWKTAIIMFMCHRCKCR